MNRIIMRYLMKVTSFEISKKLKELGVDLTTNIGWSDIDLPSYYGVPGMPAQGFVDISTSHSEYILFCCETGFKFEDGCKAYTLEDILEVLPVKFKLGWHVMPNEISHANKKGLNCMPRKEDETLADTAARLLIKLLEDKIITVDEVNNESKN